MSELGVETDEQSLTIGKGWEEEVEVVCGGISSRSGVFGRQSLNILGTRSTGQSSSRLQVGWC